MSRETLIFNEQEAQERKDNNLMYDSSRHCYNQKPTLMIKKKKKLFLHSSWIQNKIIFSKVINNILANICQFAPKFSQNGKTSSFFFNRFQLQTQPSCNFSFYQTSTIRSYSSVHLSPQPIFPLNQIIEHPPSSAHFILPPPSPCAFKEPVGTKDKP